MIFFYNNYRLKKEYSELEYAVIVTMGLNLLLLVQEIGYFRYYQASGVNLD